MKEEELSWAFGAWKKGVGRQIEKEKKKNDEERKEWDGRFRKKRKRTMEKEKKKNEGRR